MRKILLTTALLTAMSSMPILAQSGMPADFVPPEGYQSATADSLTFEDLTGATVYDVRGESIGDISDFVMAVDPSTQGASTSATEGTMSDTSIESTTSDSTSATTETSTTATDGNVTNGTGGTAATDGTMTEGTGTASTDSTASGTATEGTGTAATDSTATEGTGTAATDSTASTDSTATEGTGTAATDSAATEGTGTGATDGTMTGTESSTAGTDMAAGQSTDGSMTSSATTRDMGATISGEVTHAIIDVGGFLGMGTHTVAVPIEALQVFRGTNASDVRVYLPWNEDQLKQVPEYVEGDQSTLGTMQSVTQ